MPTSLAPAVCVVDDDASLLRAVQLLLRAAGFTVGAFGSAEEFLLAAKVVPPRCLVLDIHLCRLSGFVVANGSTIRSRSVLVAPTPVSATATSTRSAPRAAVVTVIMHGPSPTAAIASMALTSRFKTTCWS